MHRLHCIFKVTYFSFIAYVQLLSFKYILYLYYTQVAGVTCFCIKRIYHNLRQPEEGNNWNIEKGWEY